MKRLEFAARAVSVLLCFLLTACGGGGDSEDSQPSGAFTLSGTSATFSVLQSSAAPANVSLAMQITGANVAYVGAAYTGGQTQPSWLGINITGSGSSYNVVLSIQQTNIAPGQYTSTFSVGTADSNGNVLQSKTITVNYTVTARMAISRAAYSSTFIYGDVSAGALVSVPVVAAGQSWTAASDSSWLQIPGATQTGSATLNATVDVSALAPGQYQGKITVTNSTNSQDTASLAFTVTVQAPVLTVAQSQILLGGADGLSSTPQVLSFTLSSGAATHPFVITPVTDSGGSWLSASATTGNVGALGASVQINAVRGNLLGATYTGELTVKVTVRSLVFTQVLPVTYNLEANRIVVGAAGVGLSSSPLPARSVLSREVPVFSSIGQTNVPWQASSDQSWLSVTSSGTTGAEMTLVANATGLAAGTTHFATVTVTSSDSTVENQETIRVGLSINAAAAADLSLSATAQHIAGSPVEPVVFVNSGGANITAYNVYTGAVARTFNGVVAAAGAMVVGADGRRLYVYDSANLRVTELDALTGTFIRHYAPTSGSTTPSGGGLTFFRPAGYSILVTPSARMYDVNTTAEYFDSHYQAPVFADSLAPSIDSQYLVTDFGSVQRVRRTALSGGTITSQLEFSTSTVQGASGQACISSDLQYVYTASGAPYNFPGTSMTTHTVSRILPGSAYPNSILCLWNGVVIGGIDGYYDPSDIWVYDGPSAQELARRSSAGGSNYRRLLARGMVVSADATRLITLSRDVNSDYEIRFQSLPGAL